MKITEVDIPSDGTDGLQNISMKRIGDMVLIAGQNGSGKSRLLKKIHSSIASKPTNSIIFNHTQQKEQLLGNIVSFTQQINSLRNQNTDQAKYKIQQNENHINNWTQQIQNIENIINWNSMKFSGQGDPKAVFFVPKNLALTHYNQMNKMQYTDHANQLNNIGIGATATGALAKIKILQDQWYESTHQNSPLDPPTKQSIQIEYEKLQSLLAKLLGTTLSRDKDSDPVIFGLPIEKAQLSDGQSVLLQLTLAIHAQEADLKDLIIIMDEPENHLHPSAAIEVIEKIKSLVTDGQIWIATHSIPILAHFGVDSVWYMENGGIEYAGGKNSRKVLQSLLGDDNEQARLLDFIKLPAELASANYAFECLFEPKTVMTNGKDDQICQMRALIQQRIQSNSVIKMLDFGAGKGRLISNIVDIENNEELKQKINYVAYDPFDHDKRECLNNIERIFGNTNNRYFNKINDLLTPHDEKSFDLVILCNVLHEIESTEWKSLFLENGDITKLLKDDGHLLLVEDQHIPVGEKAYKHGFLVLDTPQIKKLFNITTEDIGFVCDSQRDGRLKAHLIPRACLCRITDTTQKTAIQDVLTLAKSEIKALRMSTDTSYKNGQLHGFWVQQLANAALILG